MFLINNKQLGIACSMLHHYCHCCYSFQSFSRMFSNKSALHVGPAGAGKSSLINLLTGTNSTIVAIES